MGVHGRQISDPLHLGLGVMNVLKGKNKETEIVVLRHYLITVSEVRMSLVYDSLTK